MNPTFLVHHLVANRSEYVSIWMNYHNLLVQVKSVYKLLYPLSVLMGAVCSFTAKLYTILKEFIHFALLWSSIFCPFGKNAYITIHKISLFIGSIQCVYLNLWLNDLFLNNFILLLNIFSHSVIYIFLYNQLSILLYISKGRLMLKRANMVLKLQTQHSVLQD